MGRYGGLDAAFNNAGIQGPARPLAEQAEEDFDRTLEVNHKGIWRSMRADCPRCQRLDDGSRRPGAHARLYPLGRVGTGVEVATTVAFLCSNAASYMTGAVVPVDGGY